MAGLVYIGDMLAGSVGDVQPDIDDDTLYAGIVLKSEPFTISGTWDPATAWPTLATVFLQGVTRLPRRTKKAMKKYWTGGNLSTRERAQIRNFLGR